MASPSAPPIRTIVLAALMVMASGGSAVAQMAGPTGARGSMLVTAVITNSISVIVQSDAAEAGVQPQLVTVASRADAAPARVTILAINSGPADATAHMTLRPTPTILVARTKRGLTTSTMTSRVEGYAQVTFHAIDAGPSSAPVTLLAAR